MRSLSSWLSVLLALAWVAGAAAAAERMSVRVMVSRISDSPGQIDPRAGRLHEKLQKEFRYASLEVLESRTLDLGVDDVGTLALPNGKSLKVRPLKLDDSGALLAVDVPGTVRTDLRVRNGHLVVIGAGRHGGGRLVISFEPSW